MRNLKKKKIYELVEVHNNKRIPLSSKEREKLEKVYPYYGAQGIVDYVDSYIFDGQYILVAEDGENLRSNNKDICNLVNGKFWVNNHAHILSANKQNITKYLFYNFNLIKFEPFVTGSAQPKLNKERLLGIETYVHEKITQQKIAAVLSALDDKIELNNKINAELEALAKTLYDYWFVQFDFPDEAGKPYKSSGGAMVWNEQLKREIPEGWEVKKLGELIEVKDGTH
ncbi:MAG: restriction endonuclease subunit S, partial [Chitinophagaceae bacterium]